MTYLGIDQSKRSTGCVWIDDTGALVEFMLICPDKALDGIELIKYQWEQLDHALTHVEAADHVLIEGLSFGSVGSGKDMLAGLNWFFRTNMDIEYGLYVGTVPVSMWRSKVLTKEEQREAKASGKDGLKKATVAKLPEEVRSRLEGYVVRNKAKKDAIYDLTDAFFIAQHCKSLYK